MSVPAPGGKPVSPFDPDEEHAFIGACVFVVLLWVATFVAAAVLH